MVGIIGLLLISVGWWVELPFGKDRSLEAVAQHIPEILQQKGSDTRNEIALLNARFNEHGVHETAVQYSDYYAALFNNSGILIAVFEDDELVFWSDNRVAFDYLFGPGIPDEQYLQLDNGWYGLRKVVKDDREYFALFLIKTSYPYNNDHLQDAFAPDFDLPSVYTLSLSPRENALPVVVGNETVFHIHQHAPLPEQMRWFNLLMVLAGLWLFLRACPVLLRQKMPLRFAVVVFPATLLTLRLATLYYPHIFSGLQVFNPSLYASSFLFPSLGDLFINSVLLLYIGHYLKKTLNGTQRRITGFVPLTLIFLMLFGLALFITPLIMGLIENSRITFTLYEVFSLDFYTLLAVSSIGFFFFAYYLLASALLQFIRPFFPMRKTLVWAALLALVVHIIASHLIGILDFKVILWPVPALLLIALLREDRVNITRPRGAILLLFFFSLLTTLWILKYTDIKERSERRVLAEKLASDEDPVTELLFASAVTTIQESQAIQRVFQQPQRFTNAALASVIEEQFTDRYWNKYIFSVHVYLPDGVYWGMLTETRPPNLRYFEDLIYEFGEPVEGSAYLHHLYSYPDNLSYLAKVPLFDADGGLQAWIIIGLESTLFPGEIGFPDLLIESDPGPLRKLSGYSFARYVDSKLVGASGEYNYRINTSLYDDNLEQYEFEDYKGFNHLIHRPDDRTLIVVSKENLSFFDEVTIFSYLFGLFGLLLLMVSYVQDPSVLNAGLFNHLNVKIQLLAMGIILVALLSFGFATRFYIESQFQEKNYSILSEKIQSVLIELENNLKNEDYLSETVIDRLQLQVARLSYVFFTDINVYDPQGVLVATSQPRIFDAGLVAPRMNAEAFVKIAINQKSDYIHPETIGKLRHLSAYVPFRNHANEILVYVNLPYFAQQEILEEELTRLLVTLVNLFVLLLALSVFAAFFITDWITRPLQLLQESLSRIELGKRNEPLHYRGSDVIGELVQEYNRKVSELEINAEQLARSERESAWREMARQVAHEIKNPLTPMKLKLQMLQKAVESGDENLEERMRRTSEALIEQIDALTQIANEFSNFAKMPRAELSEVNLNQLIENTVTLYNDVPGSDVKFTPYTQGTPIVRADYNQLMRAIQNLIKNGLQAHDDDREAVVEVSVRAASKGYLITVSDRGNGIPEEMRSRIFQPNFTTKSTGMGLGLAMVKNIVQNINGNIWFETETGIGTSFFIELPGEGHSEDTGNTHL